MDDFERLLEFKLRRMLDTIVAKPAPVRRRPGSRRDTKSADGAKLTSITSIWTSLFVPAELAPAVVVVKEAPARFG
jgi:hypothetical protein